MPAPARPRDTARQHLLSGIETFLAAHDLELDSFTLIVAHAYLIEADPALCRAISARIQSGMPVTQDWLEQAWRAARGMDEREALVRLMGRLETNLDELGRTTRDARSAASDYSSALSAHVDELSQTADPDRARHDAVADLSALAWAMLERTRELEKSMSRSELQTRALHRSLSDARRIAEEDPLTSLPNRRAFEARFTQALTESLESGQPLCVAFCDVDHFKRINDTHGHDAGDRVLKSVAQGLARLTNARCHVARHGGEEFVILFHGQTLHQAWELLDEARAQQAERRLINRANDQPFGKVTFSGGVADVMAYADPRAALSAADEAMYRAKAEGRNRILIAMPVVPAVNPAP